MAHRRQKIDWAFHIAQQQLSGISIVSYCRKNSLNCWSFYQCRSRLNTSAKKSSAPQPPTVSSSVPGSSSFVQIGTLRATSLLKIRFVDGAELSVDSVSTDLLCNLAATLQRGASRPC